MPANEFIESFRDEHRRMRDALLGLAEAFEASDEETIRNAIAAMAADAAPHFLFEREALYPALTAFYDRDYIDGLLAEHAAALEATRELAELAEAEELDSLATERGLELVRRLLPHVSDRDGLSIMVEVLPEEHLARIMRAREDSQRELEGIFGKGKKMRRVPVVQRKAKAAKVKAKTSARKPVKARAMHKKPRKSAVRRRAR
jgi:hypothetical protein